VKRVLIISPRFPPVNAPDHQRVRMSLPYFREFGWEPTVLCVTPETSDGVMDPVLARTVPADIPVQRVPAWNEERCRRWKFGHLNYRALRPLHRAGSQLLRKQTYDLIYFSTTMFTALTLAPGWKKRFGCRVVYDYQDPWSAGTANVYNRKTAPGGPFKYRLTQALSRRMEAYAIGAADHVISVSAFYPASLRAAYGHPASEQSTVIPFGAPIRDFELLPSLNISQRIFRRDDGLRHFVYVGRGGPDLNPVLESLFAAVAAEREAQPAQWSNVRLHFIGTNYSPAERTFKVVEPIAHRFGLHGIVEEHSPRIPYFEALQVMVESDGVLLIGSSSGDYTASKLFPSLLARKRVLALFHEQSLVSKLILTFPSARLASFRAAANGLHWNENVTEALHWLLDSTTEVPDVSKLIEPHSARALTQAQCAVFDRVCA
jgi:hypothetical protein